MPLDTSVTAYIIWSALTVINYTPRVINIAPRAPRRSA